MRAFLKGRKCIIIPLSVGFSLHLVSLFRDWLRTFLLQWSDFVLAPCGEYLGFWLGPAVDIDINVEAHLLQLCARTTRTARSQVPPGQAAKAYNSRAVAVTSYVSQLQPLPRRGLGL